MSALVGALHGAQFLFQVFDLVAQARRNLELEVLSGRHHLSGQLLDEFRELGLGALPGCHGTTATGGGRAVTSGQRAEAELAELIEELSAQMMTAAQHLQFEVAARLRDEIEDLKKELRAMKRAH